MLSDEEKKAIKILKINPEIIADLDEEMFEKMCEFKEKSIKELKYWASQIVLNLIEKQTKEIEEYKKQLDLDYVKNNYTSNDKIKAKIEETNNEELNYNDNDYWLEQEMKGYAIDKMQSLLNKE